MRPEKVELGQRRFCPMNGMKPCQPGCAWNVAGACAMCMLAQQAERGANELYAAVELLSGAEMEHFDNGPDEGGQGPTGDRSAGEAEIKVAADRE